MKTIHKDYSFNQNLMNQKKKRGLKYFYKYNPEAAQVSYQLNREIDKIDTTKIVVPNGLLYDGSRFIGIRTDRCLGYKTLHKLVDNNKPINTKKIITDLKQCLDELEKIGILYDDIHSDNILVRKDEIKLVDVDDARIHFGANDKIWQLRRFYDLVIDLYVYKNSTGYGDSILKLLNFSNLEDYFSNDLLSYLEHLIEGDLGVIEDYPENIIGEFEDHEKMDAIREKILK